MEPPPPTDDLVTLFGACSAAFDRRVLDETRVATGGQIRHGDGYVFQHLIVGQPTITELAARLGVTQQAASKQVADLEQRGLVARRTSSADGRVKRIELTPQGLAVIEASRASRLRIRQEVDQLLGARAAAFRRALIRVAEHAGAFDLISERAFRPESSR